LEDHVSSGQRPADDVIVDHLRLLPPADRKRSTLVTDDRNLADRARRTGVRVEGTTWLSARLPQPSRGRQTEPGLPREELGEWEEFFRQPPRRPGTK
jgi:hypothetical protein